MDNRLSPDVQMQLMRPAQLEAAGRRFPVVYVPFGEDPRQTASAEIGRRNVELAAEAIGRKARELLNALPAECRTFNLPAVSPEHWWMV